MLDGDCPYPIHWPTLIIGVAAAFVIVLGFAVLFMELCMEQTPDGDCGDVE